MPQIDDTAVHATSLIFRDAPQTNKKHCKLIKQQLRPVARNTNRVFNGLIRRIGRIVVCWAGNKRFLTL